MQLELKENPFAILFNENSDFSEVKKFFSEPSTFLPGIIAALVQSSILLVSVVLWPYGFIYVLADYFWQITKQTVKQLDSSTEIPSGIALVISIAIYFLLFVSFTVSCLPLVLLVMIYLLIEAIFKQDDLWLIIMKLISVSVFFSVVIYYSFHFNSVAKFWGHGYGKVVLILASFVLLLLVLGWIKLCYHQFFVKKRLSKLQKKPKTDKIVPSPVTSARRVDQHTQGASIRIPPNAKTLRKDNASPTQGAQHGSTNVQSRNSSPVTHDRAVEPLRQSARDPQKEFFHKTQLPAKQPINSPSDDRRGENQQEHRASSLPSVPGGKQIHDPANNSFPVSPKRIVSQREMPLCVMKEIVEDEEEPDVE